MKKPDTSHTLCDSTSVKCAEQANLQRQKDSWLLGAGGGRVSANGWGISFWADENVSGISGDVCTVVEMY